MENENMTKEESKVEFGPHREPGTAGPQADYIMQTLERWSLRGDGVLKS